MSKTFINIPSYTWQSPVQTLAELPNSGNIGDVRLVIDQSAEYWWDGTTWIPTIAGGGSTNSFVIMQTDLGTYPTATSATDTLTFTSSDNSITITGNSATDTIDLKVAAVGGVSSVNSLTGALTINSGTSGTDFAVNSSGSTITLNLPIASATNTGKLSSTDWSTFNNKVSTSRTISTSSPLTGGGDLSTDRTISFSNQSANTVLAGPTSGGPAAPTFRALVASDIPPLSSLYANVTLSNLGTVALNSDLLPATDFSRSLGSFTKRFNKIYADGLYGSANTKIFDFFSVTVSDNSNIQSANFLNRALFNSGGLKLWDWAGTSLYSGGSIIPTGSHDLGDTDHLWNKIYPTFVQGNSDLTAWDVYSGGFFDTDTDNYAESLNVISRRLNDSVSGDVRVEWDKNLFIYTYPTDMSYPVNGNLVLSTSPAEVTLESYGSIVSYNKTGDGGVAIANRPSLLVGTSGNGGTIKATSDAALAIGKVEGAGSFISATSDASFATGMVGVSTQGLIYSSGNASWANGLVYSDYGRIEANGNAAHASGYVSGNGASSNYIEAIGPASRAEGYMDSGDDSYITAQGEASFAGGRIGSGTSYIQANASAADIRASLTADGTRAYVGGEAGFIRGQIGGTNSYMDVNGSGGWAGGYIENGDLEVNNAGLGFVRLSGGHVRLESEGGFAFVSSDCDTDSYAYVYGEANFMVLKMDGTAAYAETTDDAASMFVRNNSGSAYSTGKGAQVRGDIGVNGASGGVLRASAEAATVIGRATEGGVIEATGTLTWSWGDDSKGNISTTGNRGASWGTDIENTGSDAYVFGYSLSNANNDVFIIGFGGETFKVEGTDVYLPNVGSSGFVKLDTGGVLVNDTSSYVPETRTLTINGVDYDLSADRSWTTEVPLTFSTGLTRTVDTITNNLSTGVSGGQSAIGGTGSGENLTLSSTSNVTKGKVIFGSASAYDEVNDRIGVSTTSPASKIEIITNNLGTTQTRDSGLSLSNNTSAANGAQQYSPSIRFKGQGWKTAATAASQNVEAQIYLRPVQGSSTPTASLDIDFSINGGAFSNQFNLSSSGALSVGAISGTSASINGSYQSSTTSTSSNFFITGNTISGNQTASQFLTGAASAQHIRTFFYGSTSSTLAIGSNYSAVLVARAPISTAASGTHAFLTNLSVTRIGTVTNAGATVTNTASLYVDGAGTGGTNNYALYVASGTTYLGGSVTTGGNLTMGSSSTIQPSSGNLTLTSFSQTRVTASGSAAQFDMINDGQTKLTQSVTGSASTVGLQILPTWNTSGTPTGLLVKVTDTASNAASKLLDLQVGTTSLLNVSKNGKITLDSTYTAGGTTGDQTINKPSGSVNFAAAATSLTVTNSLVTTSSIITCVVMTNDSTAYIKNVVPGSGSFTINLGAAATAETKVGFIVYN